MHGEIFNRALGAVFLLAGLLIANGAEVARAQTVERKQSADEVWVRVGKGDWTSESGRQLATYYAPYALMAAKAYNEESRDLCSDPSANGTKNGSTLVTINRGLCQGWEWVKNFTEKELGCQPGESCLRARPFSVAGLFGQIWRRKSKSNGVCSEIAIVFRGTDGAVFDDWISNTRWLTRTVFFLVADQYDHVRQGIHRLIKQITEDRCYRPSTRIVAVGHSLGGGLAQHAAYVHGKIKYVYAFDPTFVTGYLDVDPTLRNDNRKRLGIDRVYQRGEALATPRAVTQAFFEPTPCDPRVRLVRFNVLQGNLLTQHSINELAQKLFAWNDETGRAKRVVKPSVWAALQKVPKNCEIQEEPFIP